MADSSATSMQDMAMQKAELIDLPRVCDPRGNLSFLQEGNPLAFDIKRCYWIYDVPGGRQRQGRALRTAWECIVALSGSFDAELTGPDGEKQTFHLCRSYKAAVVPPMHWRELKNFSTNSVALVLSSTLYDEADYIRDFSTFKQETNG